MRKTTAERKDNMNDNRINDYGKMRRDGETLDRKQFTTTLHKHTGIEWLEEGHKRNNWWRTSEVNKKWLWTKRVDFNSKKHNQMELMTTKAQAILKTKEQLSCQL